MPVGEAGPNIFGFMLVSLFVGELGLQTIGGELKGGGEEEVLVKMLDIGIDGGPDEPSGITIICSNFQAVKMIRDPELCRLFLFSLAVASIHMVRAVQARLEDP